MTRTTMSSEPLLLALDVLPRHAFPFLWADYVELLCLCSSNGLVSKGNLQAQAQEAQDLQADARDEDDSEDAVDDSTTAARDDRMSAHWSKIHLRLQARRTSFPGWPFTLEKDLIRSSFQATNPAHQLYAALLIASSLRLCNAKRRGEVTAAFEEISYHWLRGSLNPLWEVRQFGANPTMPAAYKGTLFQKLTTLARDIRGVLQKTEGDYDPANTGDAGIDLVAWQRMGDERGNMPVIFGQCACSPTDWESKQLDVTPASTEAHIQPQHPGAAFCFVPHDLSLDERTWERASHVKRTVMVDRARLLHLFAQTKAWSTLPNWPFVAEAAATGATAAT